METIWRALWSIRRELALMIVVDAFLIWSGVILLVCLGVLR